MEKNNQKILQQGAEAIIYLDKNKITKKRISKSYRINFLDKKIRKLRTRHEAKILEKLQDKILVPKIFKSDEDEKRIIMEFVDGKKLSENLNKYNLEKQKNILKKIGESVAKLHNQDIIHSDLTTSNMILIEGEKSLEKESFALNNERASAASEPNRDSNREGGLKQNFQKISEKEKSEKEISLKIFFIDFGLSFHSSKFEDKAVDIHLFKQALEAKHFQNWEKLFQEFLKGYKEESEKEKSKLFVLNNSRRDERASSRAFRSPLIASGLGSWNEVERGALGRAGRGQNKKFHKNEKEKNNFEKTIEQLKKVEKRGRYKH